MGVGFGAKNATVSQRAINLTELAGTHSALVLGLRMDAKTSLSASEIRDIANGQGVTRAGVQALVGIGEATTVPDADYTVSALRALLIILKQIESRD